MSNAVRRRTKKANKQKLEAEMMELQRKIDNSRAMNKEVKYIVSAIISMIIFFAGIMVQIFWLKITLFILGCVVATPYIKNRFFSK